MSDKGQIYECVEAFSILYQGVPITVTAGERVREGHELLERARAHFRPLTIQYDIERATKAPGEKRGSKKP